MVRNFLFRVASRIDQQATLEISDPMSICNFRANRLCCDAADQTIQVHGGTGYTRALAFEHIYCYYHRRYCITKGSEEMQSAASHSIYSDLGASAYPHEFRERACANS